MHKNLIPTYHLKNIFSLNINWLKEKKIQTIFIDLDNTLANPYVALPNEKVIAFIQSLSDFSIVILSNNHEDRVKKFTENLPVSYLYEVKKPNPAKVLHYIEKHQLKKEYCLAIGDQIMTDVLCANRAGIKVILVDPLTKQDEPITFFPRLLDQHFRKKIYKHHLSEEL